MTRVTKIIDASGQSVGRVASLAARHLQGKHRSTYAPNVDAGDIVEIKNVRALRWTGRKLSQKEYHSTSGFLGGLKTAYAADLFEKNPSYIVEHAVYSMLPANKLRAARMKRLKIV